MKPDLQSSIASWDGKSAEIITTIYNQHHQTTGFAERLVALLAHAPLQKGATWLLKRWLENGGEISAETTQTYFQHADSLVHWEAQLHLLQSLQYLSITDGQIETLYAFIQRNLTHKKTFVRAWSYSGMYTLAKQHPQFRSEAEALFIKAHSEESASIRARIRQFGNSNGEPMWQSS